MLALFAGAADARQPRIVGGTTAAPGGFGFQAGLHLRRGDGEERMCGGALIAARWVVTAAHCLADAPLDLGQSHAVLGSASFDAPRTDQRYALADAFFDPGYSRSRAGHDVGLIELARPAGVAPLRLLRSSDEALWAPSTTAVALGWGYTEDPADGGEPSTEALRQVDLRIYADNECAEAFDDYGAHQELDFSTQLCALAPDRDTCTGDSGGPLLVSDPATGEWTLAGTVSFGVVFTSIFDAPRSCNEGAPGVYARLGAEPLNGFVRTNVPQVELDTEPRDPAARTRVFFTARPNAPGGSGPFGGYDSLTWDLDGDGSFDDASDRTSVARRFDEGTHTVAVRATTLAGDDETRRIVVNAGPRTTIEFAGGSFGVRRGRPVRVVLRRNGTGTGTVMLRARGRGVRPYARTVRFTPRRAKARLRIPTRRRARGGIRLRLTRFTGQLSAGGLAGARAYFR